MDGQIEQEAGEALKVMEMKPILFNTEMVRAILEGRKTVTRRVIKTQHKNAYGFYVCRNKASEIVGICDYDEDETMFDDYSNPPYQVGDVLYVRETFAQVAKYTFWYRATAPKGCENILWRPSIHMPKEAARIFLKVTDVRVGRLQDMTIDDVHHEGVSITRGFEDFTKLWDSTIKKENLHLYGWGANPYVWVIEFERCEKPESEEI